MIGTEPVTEGTKTVRERVLDAAVDLLESEGVKGLSQTRVARKAGVRQSHLTYYFPRKKDLMVAVARHSILRVAINIQEEYGSETYEEAPSDVQARIIRLISFVVKNRQRSRVLIGLLAESEEDEELRKTIVESFQHTRVLICRGLGLDEDDLLPDLIWAALCGIGIQHLLFEGVRSDDYTESLISMLPAFKKSIETQ